VFYNTATQDRLAAMAALDEADVGGGCEGPGAKDLHVAGGEP
jgi:hypothetical protein